MSTGTIHLDARPPYVRGEYKRTYDLTHGIDDVDRHLARLKQSGALNTHPDVDLLLDARHALAAREKATATKEATA